MKLEEQHKLNLDTVLAESNSLSKEIGLLFKSGEVQKANLVKEKTGQLKEQSKQLSQQLTASQEALNELLYQIPKYSQFFSA